MYIIQIIISGVSVGIIYGMVGFCFTSIYNVSQIINFAQGDFFMLGAFFAFIFYTTLQLPLPAALVLTIVSTAIVAWLGQRLIVAPLAKRQAETINLVIGTMAISMLISGIVGMKTNYGWMKVLPIFGDIKVFRIFGLYTDSQTLSIIIITAVLVLSYWIMLKKTLFGMAFRATGFNSAAVRLIGARPLRMLGYAFLISAAMSAIGGFLIGPITAPNANMGFPLVVKGFIAAVIGGLGNPYAAILGGILLGVITYFLNSFVGTAYSDVIAFAAFILILVIRPEGIIGERV